MSSEYPELDAKGIRVELLPPKMPNFIRLGEPFNKGTVAVGMISPEAIEDLIEDWGRAFRAHAAKKRAEFDETYGLQDTRS